MDLIPPPPATPSTETQVITILSTIDSGFYYWRPVVSSRHDAWVGVVIDAIPSIHRSWVFDVIDPAMGIELPLTINAEPDVISASVYDETRPSVRGKVLIDYTDGPRDVFIPKSILPPSPWTLDLSLTWSSEKITEMLMMWTQARTGRDDVFLLSQSKPEKKETYSIRNDLVIDSEYFDFVLNLPPDDASIIIGTLGLVVEFLSDSRS